MLSRFRARARGVAAAVLLSLSTFGGSFLVAHADDCHDGCLAFVAHDASAHRIDRAAPGDPAHPLHCLVCHWSRSFRPRIDAAFVAAPAARTGPRIHVEPFTAAGPVLAAQPPLRSPPV